MASLNGGVVGVDNLPVASASARVSTFNSSGTFTALPTSSSVQYLVIAGGGGGSGYGNAGGGAGGYRSSVPGEASGGGASAEPLSSVSGGSSYPVVVGGGGVGGVTPGAAPNPGTPGGGQTGSDSVFGTLTAKGGGATPSDGDGQPGGSGG